MKISSATRLRLLARLFTRPVISALASSQPLPQLLATWVEHGVLERSNTNRGSVRDLMDAAWNALAAQYRCEYVYKNDLATKLIFQRHRPHTAAFLSEFSVKKSIADVVVVNGTTTAYEVKTQYDSGRRLSTQTSDYLKVFDRVYLVAHHSLVERLSGTLDDRVGVISMNDNGAMQTLLKAQSNAANVDPSSIFRCLRKPEYLKALRLEFGEAPDLPNGLINAASATAFSSLPSQVAHTHLVSALRSRTTDAAMTAYVQGLPASMRALGYSAALSKAQRARLLQRLSTICPLNIRIYT
jgi:hypothetical protein